MKLENSFSDAAVLQVRRATMDDMPTVVRLAVELALQHNKYDERRFDLASLEPLGENHAEYLTKQLQNKNSTFLVAESKGKIIGYAFLRVEPQNFLDLLNEGVWLHDIYFEESARGRGFGKIFFDAIIDEAKNMGSNFLMLTVSPQNKTGQKFFKQIGFRPTMQEMRLDF
jgi:GNAT superfamily N-acetyltransferase